MGQLRGWTITYNGINSERFDLYLCEMNNGKTRSVGYQQSVETEDTGRDVPIFKKLKRTTPSFEVQLVKLSKNNIPLKITEEDMFHINRWLFSVNTNKTLMVDCSNVVYYGVFTKADIWQNEGEQGYLTLTFQMASPYAYSTINNSEFYVRGSKTLTLSSKHNASQFNEVDIEFVLDEGETSLTIENQTTGQTMQFFDLNETCRHVYVYNEGMKHVISRTNGSINMLNKFNKVFIHLDYGNNIIKITGSGKVRFISQAKILLQ